MFSGETPILATPASSRDPGVRLQVTDEAQTPEAYPRIYWGVPTGNLKNVCYFAVKVLKIQLKPSVQYLYLVPRGISEICVTLLEQCVLPGKLTSLCCIFAGKVLQMANTRIKNDRQQRSVRYTVLCPRGKLKNLCYNAWKGLQLLQLRNKNSQEISPAAGSSVYTYKVTWINMCPRKTGKFVIILLETGKVQSCV